MKYQKVTCPNCNERLQVEAGNEGKSFACPKCHATVTVPSVAEQAAVERPTPPPRKTPLPKARAIDAVAILFLFLLLCVPAFLFSSPTGAIIAFGLCSLPLLVMISARLAAILAILAERRGE